MHLIWPLILVIGIPFTIQAPKAEDRVKLGAVTLFGEVTYVTSLPDFAYSGPLIYLRPQTTIFPTMHWQEFSLAVSMDVDISMSRLFG